MNELFSRVAWAIEIIRADRNIGKGIKDVDLAKMLGTNDNTLAAYRKQKGLLKGEVIANLVACYNFNPMWLLKGEGEPFPGARAKYPEVCGTEAAPPMYLVNEKSAHYATPQTATGAPAQQFSIDEDLMITASVLASKTHYATALHLNIRSFSGAIAAETEMFKCKDDLRKQGELIEQMQANLKSLREEILKLKGSSGDSPPIALGTDHAALTGTEDPET